MPTRHRTSLCREGWYVLLLLAVVLTWALLRENNLLLLVSGLICGMLLIDWRMSVAALRRLEVRRRIVSGSHAGAGSRSRSRCSTTAAGSPAGPSRSRTASHGRPLRRRDQPLRPRVMFPFVPAGQRVRQTYRMRLPQRGRYALGPLRISTRFPFGLVQRTVWLEGDDELVVLPRLGQLRPAWLRYCPPAPHGVHGARRPGYVPGDFFAVREWQAGDSVRWVHWRSTARHRELVVRQFEQPGERQLAVLLDLWAPEEPLGRPCAAGGIGRQLCRDAGRGFLPPTESGGTGNRRRTESICLAGRAAGPFSRQAFVALALAEASPAGSAVVAARRSPQPNRAGRRTDRDQHASRRGRGIAATGRRGQAEPGSAAALSTPRRRRRRARR